MVRAFQGCMSVAMSFTSAPGVADKRVEGSVSASHDR
jgi:hypothetical protein